MNDLVPADDVRERLTRLVTDSLTSPHSKRAYAKALDEFFTWVQGKGSFSKALVTAYKSWLEEKNLAPATINLRLAAVRKLAEEAGSRRDRCAAPGLFVSPAAPRRGNAYERRVPE